MVLSATKQALVLHEEEELELRYEYKSIIDSWTYDLVKLPDRRKAIDTCWLFKLKQLTNGTINQFKARWIVKGYSQIFSINYNKTFSPIMHIKHLRLLIALAMLLRYKIHQMDVTTVFLNATLTEENYICQPQGFVDPE